MNTAVSANSTFWTGNDEEMSNMQEGIGKIHFVKKEGQWMRLNEKHILHTQSRSEVRKQSSFSKSPLKKYSKLQSSSHHKYSHSTNHRVSKQHNKHNMQHSQKTNSRALTTTEICAELECTPNRQHTISSSSPSPDEFLHSQSYSALYQKTNRGDFGLECTQDTLQKSIRSNTKENSPVKENRFQQISDNESVMKAATSYGKASLVVNTFAVSPGNILSGLTDNSRKLLASSTEAENGISVLPEKFDLFDQRKRKSPPSDSMQVEMKKNRGVKMHPGIFHSCLNEPADKEVQATSPSSFNILMEHKAHDTTRKHKIPIFETRENFSNRKVTVDALLNNGEVQMGIGTPIVHSSQHKNINTLDLIQGIYLDNGQLLSSNERHLNETSSLDCSMPGYNQDKEANASHNINFVVPRSTYFPCDSSLASTKQEQNREVNSSRSDHVEVELDYSFDSKNLINLDQLYQDLAGVPMVQLEKLSEKTLQHYYGVKSKKC